MVFASLGFLYIFLPLNLILYYVWNNKMYRNILLTLFSFVFYAWGEPVWILLLLFSATLDYGNALFIEKYRGTPLAKLGLVSTVVLNLGLLAVFKYGTFICDNINSVFSLHIKSPGFSLPIGISFYTFQTISYVVDVYRNEVKAQRSWIKFAMFVSLYHQLVAGPIVRYSHIADEIDNRKFDIKDMSEGFTRFCIGLFKKVFIANVAGEFVLQYMGAKDFSGLSVSEAWFGLCMYAVQIYFDFSGYSDMAIGLGKMFGFHYLENFNYPYIATSATDFWRRWHISLGTFFRDYIYIPMGGKRKNAYFNLFVVWFLTGLWHGPSWNFILWGLFFGVLIVIEKTLIKDFFKGPLKFLGHIYFIFIMLMGWALFYFTDLHKLKNYLSVMFGFTKNPLGSFEFGLVLQENIFWLLFTIVLCLPVYPFLQKKFSEKSPGWQIQSLRTGTIFFNVFVICIATALLVGKSYNPFLYFRF
ncbi:MAG: MBOAT family protein [Bacteroidia bacterium]|nr:MBOAT family protein [Bacteroidia bacterium]